MLLQIDLFVLSNWDVAHGGSERDLALSGGWRYFTLRGGEGDLAVGGRNWDTVHGSGGRDMALRGGRRFLAPGDCLGYFSFRSSRRDSTPGGGTWDLDPGDNRRHTSLGGGNQDLAPSIRKGDGSLDEKCARIRDGICNGIRMMCVMKSSNINLSRTYMSIYSSRGFLWRSRLLRIFDVEKNRFYKKYFYRAIIVSA